MNRKIGIAITSFLSAIISVNALAHITFYDAIKFSWSIVSLIILGTLGYVNYKFFAEIRKNENRDIFIFSFLFCFSIILGQYLANEFSLNGMAILLLFVYACSFVPSCTLVIIYIQNRIQKMNIINEGNSRHGITYLKIFGLIFAAWFPIFLAYYPGIFAYDVGSQMRQILSGEYHDKHPLVHTLLLELFYNIGKVCGNINIGIALFSIFQMLLLASIIALGYSYLIKYKMMPIVRYGYIIFFMLVPINGMMAISITKDIIFSGLVLLYTVLLYDLLDNHIEQKIWKEKRFLLLIGVAVLMIQFRNNAIHAFILTIVLQGLVLMKKAALRNKVVLVGIVIVVLSIFSQKTLEYVLEPAHGSIRGTLSIPFQQMGRVYQEHKEELEPYEIDELKELMPTIETYNPYLSDPIKSSADVRGNEVRILKLWKDLLIKYPYTYIEAFLYANMGEWFVDDDSNGAIYSDKLESRMGYMLSFNADDYGVEHHSYFPQLEGQLEKLFSANEYKKYAGISLIFSLAIYYWIIIYIMIKALFKKKLKILLTGLFLLCYHFTMLCGPCALTRYMYPIIICTPFMIGIFMKEMRENE